LVKETVTNFVNELIKSQEELFLVDVIIKGNQGNQKILVLIDGDEGITIDTCATISRSLGKRLEEEDLIDGKYLLEVSSPGLDHPISLRRQYEKNVGRKVSIETLDGLKREGILKSISEDLVCIEIEGEIHEIDFNNIRETKILVLFK
jgi:ribosome maturation factor RimP